MDAQTYVLAYTGHGNDGYIQTFTIPADGSSITQVKQKEHNTKYSSWNSLIQVDHNTYALAYHGNDGTDSHVTLTTFTIPLGGSSITEVATLKHAITGGWGRYHSLLKLNSDEYALAFSYIDEVGYVKTFTISDDGETIAEQWSVLHDTNQGIWNDLIRIDKDTYALSVLAQVLSTRTGRLHKQVVLEQKLATDTWAWVRGLKYAGQFNIGAELAEGKSLEETESALYEQIDKLKAEPVPKQELQKVKNNFAASEYRRLSSNHPILMQLLRSEGTGNWREINEAGPKIQAVTPAALQRVAKKYFV